MKYSYFGKWIMNNVQHKVDKKHKTAVRLGYLSPRFADSVKEHRFQNERMWMNIGSRRMEGSTL
jgi:hypothetical protein